MVPIEVSNRHVHLSQQDVAVLFGTSVVLHPRRAVSQTGQFAAEETVTIIPLPSTRGGEPETASFERSRRRGVHFPSTRGGEPARTILLQNVRGAERGQNLPPFSRGGDEGRGASPHHFVAKWCGGRRGGHSSVGAKAQLEDVRVVGPARRATQVELSRTDARHLGIEAPIRDSGDLKGSAGVTLVGPHGKIDVVEGVIVQRRHIHANPDDCRKRGIKPGAIVRVRIGGERGALLDNVFVKVDPSFTWRLHLDTDEANAAGIVGGETAEVWR